MTEKSKWFLLILAIAGTVWLIYYLFWIWSRDSHPAIYLLAYSKDPFRLILSGFIVAITIGVEIVVFRWLFRR